MVRVLRLRDSNRMVRHSYRWVLLLLSVAWILLASAQQEQQQQATDESISSASSVGQDHADEQQPQEQTQSEPQVVVNDYLDSLSNADLNKICRDRGFEIAPRPDGMELSREDYLAGARRCLTLEDEMNAILAENPELAAELDAEIARIKASKERLERERDEILAEKNLLEEQLRKAGVDNVDLIDGGGSEKNQTRTSRALQQSGGPPDPPLTLEEVLKESFTLLFQRVMQDVQFVRKVLSPVLIPMGYSIKLVWRYSRPTVMGLWEKARTMVAQQFYPKQQETTENPPSADSERTIPDNNNNNTTETL